MKKIVLWVGVVMLLWLIGGCMSDQTDDPLSAVTPVPTATPHITVVPNPATPSPVPTVSSNHIVASVFTVALTAIPRERIQTPEPTESCTEDEMVYVWITNNGSKYHNDPDCSNMKHPSRVKLTDVGRRTKCGKCY